eukprot:gene21746-biopygen22196
MDGYKLSHTRCDNDPVILPKRAVQPPAGGRSSANFVQSAAKQCGKSSAKACAYSTSLAAAGCDTSNNRITALHKSSLQPPPPLPRPFGRRPGLRKGGRGVTVWTSKLHGTANGMGPAIVCQLQWTSTPHGPEAAGQMGIPALGDATGKKRTRGPAQRGQGQRRPPPPRVFPQEETVLPAFGPRPARVRFFECYRSARARSASAAVSPRRLAFDARARSGAARARRSVPPLPNCKWLRSDAAHPVPTGPSKLAPSPSRWPGDSRRRDTRPGGDSDPRYNAGKNGYPNSPIILFFCLRIPFLHLCNSLFSPERLGTPHTTAYMSSRTGGHRRSMACDGPGGTVKAEGAWWQDHRDTHSFSGRSWRNCGKNGARWSESSPEAQDGRQPWRSPQILGCYGLGFGTPPQFFTSQNLNPSQKCCRWRDEGNAPHTGCRTSGGTLVTVGKRTGMFAAPGSQVAKNQSPGGAQGGGGWGSVFSLIFKNGSKRPGNSGLRIAMRPAARARSGRANDTDGLRE